MAKKVLSATQQKNKATLKEKLKDLTVDQLRTKLKGKVKLSTREGKPLTKAQLVNKAADLQVTTPTQKKKVAKRTPTRNYTYKGDSAAARKRDGAVQALPPGKRVSKTGKVYYEYRRNRADIKQGAKRGQMLGESYNGWSNYWTWKYMLEIVNEERWRDSIEFGEFSNIYQLSKAIQEDSEFLVEEVQPDWATDWVSAAFSEVNWREIALALAEGTNLKQ
jgi:hypothetical protein